MHRFESETSDLGVTLVFQGTFDEAALRDLDSLCKRFCDQRVPVLVLLDEGTQMETGLLEKLLTIEGIKLEAKSPFLAKWIANVAARKEEV
jgi:hypothetical protein